MKGGSQEEENNEGDCGCQGWVIGVQLRVVGGVHSEEVFWAVARKRQFYIRSSHAVDSRKTCREGNGNDLVDEVTSVLS